jgi:phosphoglycolate phosphatase
MAVIIFDFDGTIADSFDYVADFLVSTAGRADLSESQKHELRGLSMMAMARKLGFSWWRMPSLFFKGRKRMGRSIKQLKPFKGIPELLDNLHSEGHELFIISTNSLHNVRSFLKMNQLNHYFLEIYGGVGLFSKAPALKKLFKEQNLSVKNAVYVGDEVRDIQAASSIGLKSVAVAWGFAKTEDLRSHRPAALAKKPDDLKSILEAI